MVSPEFSHHPQSSSPMAKPRNRSFLCLPDGFLLVGSAFLALLLVPSFWSFFTPTQNFEPTVTDPSTKLNKSPVDCSESGFGVNLKYDPKNPTFYDDPEMSYSIEKPVKDWDEKREEWLKHHSSFAAGARDRIVLVTGSQPKPCKNPIGDHLLLRFFKNKVDYCRIHGYDVFYNNLLLHPKMGSYWAKLPVVKAAMLAHPEAEWIWWVDSDALFTDMEFKLPLERYKNHNMVVHGWPKLIYIKKSWTSLNAGVFLIRNCQWSMELVNTWSSMGPMSKDYEKWGEIQRSTFKDKLFPESDDQSALIYLLYTEKEKYYDHIYLEGEFYFEGYWAEIIGGYENTTERYLEIERGAPKLRRRHGEKVSEQYAAFREEFLKEAGNGKGSWRRPLITHFTGCQPCSGDHNLMYKGESCWNGMVKALNFADNQVLPSMGLYTQIYRIPLLSLKYPLITLLMRVHGKSKSCWNGMVKALNFADNQVLRKYGFVHPDLQDSSTVTEVPFDYPADEGPW